MRKAISSPDWNWAPTTTSPNRSVRRWLVARVRRLLRKSEENGLNGDVIKIHDLVIDPARRECLLKGQPLSLTLSEFNILTTLARRPGLVFNPLPDRRLSPRGRLRRQRSGRRRADHLPPARSWATVRTISKPYAASVTASRTAGKRGSGRPANRTVGEIRRSGRSGPLPVAGSRGSSRSRRAWCAAVPLRGPESSPVSH